MKKAWLAIPAMAMCMGFAPIASAQVGEEIFKFEDFFKMADTNKLPTCFRNHNASEPEDLWLQEQTILPASCVMVEKRRIELPTSALRTQRSPS